MFDLILALAAAAAGQTADPLAQARAGKLQCVNPNTTAKTCQALASYTVRADGSFDSVTTTLLAPAPLITMVTKSSGKVEGNLVCGPILAKDYADSTFLMDGAAMDPAMAEGIKAQVTGAITPMIGKKGCSNEKAEGDVLVAEVTLDGTARPDLSQKYIWVGASDGYKVGG